MTHAGVTIHSFVRSPRIAELESILPIVAEDEEASDELRATLCGQIVAVKAEEGQEVDIGGELIVLSAMKLENTVTAERKVKIKKICVIEGEQVAVDQILIEFEAS